MAKLNDLTSNKVQERKRQVRTYGTKTDLASTVVERGSTHWAEGSNVHIDGLLGVAGTATVSGVLSVTGTFNASGSINLSGSTSVTGPLVITGTTTIGGNTNITGELNVTGPTALDGILDIGGDTTITGLLSIEGDSTISGKLDVTGAMSTKGTLSVEGVTTLKNDLNVTEGGKITAGDLMIEPAAGGQVNFLNGSLADGSFGAVLTNTIKVELSAPQIDLSATNVYASNRLTVRNRFITQERVVLQNMPTGAAGAVANVHIDSNGFLWKVV